MNKRYFLSSLVWGVAALISFSAPICAQTVVATVPVGGNPIRVAVNATTNRIYVTTWLGSCPAWPACSTLHVIDGNTNTVIATIPVGGHAFGLAVNPVTNLIYVANFIDVKVIDGATNTVVTAFGAGPNENSAAVNPVTNRIYIGGNAFLGPVHVFNGVDNTFVATITTDGMPSRMGVNSLTNRIYVTKQYDPATRVQSNTLSVIDGASNTEIATIPIGTGLQGVAVNPATNRIYVANPNSSRVAVINGETNTVEATVGVGSFPLGIAVNPTTNHIYVANLGSNTVSAIDGVNHCRVTIPVGINPQAVAGNPGTNRIYVANSGSGTLSVIEDPNASLTCDTSPPTWPAGSALTASNVGLTSLTLNWTPAADNVGVVAYKVFRGGTLLATVAAAASAFNVAGLAPCTEYSFKMEACDAEGNCSTDGPSLTVRTLTPVQALGSIIQNVNGLVAAGLLNRGQGDALVATLQAAIQQLNQGNVSAAINLLQAFLEQVDAFVSAGLLSPAQVQLLKNAANQVIARPTC